MAARACKGAGCARCGAKARGESLRQNRRAEATGFGEVRPELLSEWDTERNAPRRAEEFSYASAFQGVVEMRRRALLADRDKSRAKKGSNCPQMSAGSASETVRQGPTGREPCRLGSDRPELLLDWNYERNAPRRPEEFHSQATLGRGGGARTATNGEPSLPGDVGRRRVPQVRQRARNARNYEPRRYGGLGGPSRKHTPSCSKSGTTSEMS